MKRTLAGLGLVVSLAIMGCQADGTGPADESQLAALSPAGGSVDVVVTANVTIAFTHAMMSGMEQYVALHEGSVAGPVVTGTWTWSTDRRTLTFVPASPLKIQTDYVIHAGGGMRDSQNHMVGLENGMGMGGQWATSSMMGSNSGMMGTGWQMSGGAYGMIFTFRTN